MERLDAVVKSHNQLVQDFKDLVDRLNDFIQMEVTALNETRGAAAASRVALRTLLSDTHGMKRLLSEDFQAMRAHLPENLNEDFALAFSEEEQAFRQAAGE